MNWIFFLKGGKHAVFCLALMPLLVLAGSASASPLAAGEQVTWQIHDTKVIDAGQSMNLPDGTLTSDYIVDATATAVGDAPVSEGFFRLTCSAFKPRKDMPGQKSGRWYVRGVWTITKKNADEETLKNRHNNAKVKGMFMAELPFNPTTGNGSVEARVKWPLTLIGKHWAQGEGFFSGNALFEGQLNLTLLRWQKVK